MPVPQPQRRVTRTFTNLSRRPPTPDNKPLTVSPQPRAAFWLGRLHLRRTPVTPPARAELDKLPAKERYELWDAYRQRPFQTITALITSIGVLLSVAFTAYGLNYTAQTLSTTQESQITDRYTKAVEQLASKAVDVRLGAIYALQRIAADSRRDRPTVRNVLAAFVRNHDLCSPKPPPRQCSVKVAKSLNTPLKPVRLPADLQAALTIASALSSPKDSQVDFSHTRFTNADLIRADLTNVNLTGAHLPDANLTRAYLTGATLIEAELTGVYLTHAHLPDANLTGAYLSGATLIKADLTGANLSGATLIETDLTGAILTNIKGMTADEIRKVAITDSTTQF